MDKLRKGRIKEKRLGVEAFWLIFGASEDEQGMSECKKEEEEERRR